MKKCPYCAEEIKDEAIKCRFCGEFLTTTPEDTEKPLIQDKPESNPQVKEYISKKKKKKQKSGKDKTPFPVAEGEKPVPEAIQEVNKALLEVETQEAIEEKKAPAIETKEIIEEKTAHVQEKHAEDKKKKDWILIIAIIVFGILLLVIQFSKQLGIEGFP